MRKSHALALVAVMGFWSPASAAEYVSSATTQRCSSGCPEGVSSLSGFSSALGTLTGITLHIEGQTLSQYIASRTSLDPASGTLTYAGPFRSFVNGVEYVFDISGTQAAAVNNFGLFSATGSADFVLDQSLFASFTDANHLCRIGAPLGVCVSDGTTVPIPSQIATTTSNLQIMDLDIGVISKVTITYSYTPSTSVPEPATWAMMLLGFGGIGMTMRRRNSVQAVAS